MREYSIAAISADGIGPEVIDASLSVLEVPERLEVRLGNRLTPQARRDDTG